MCTFLFPGYNDPPLTKSYDPVDKDYWHYAPHGSMKRSANLSGPKFCGRPRVLALPKAGASNAWVHAKVRVAVFSSSSSFPLLNAWMLGERDGGSLR